MGLTFRPMPPSRLPPSRSTGRRKRWNGCGQPGPSADGDAMAAIGPAMGGRGREVTRMATEAQIKAQARYDAENTRQVHLKLNRRTDEDVLEKLDSVPSKQGYIKELIRADLKR